MKENPLISVIVPVYNTEKYLHQCVDSILAQTLQNIEIILIDDGSTDNSWNILKEYAKQDKRIFLIKQENSGVGVARNRGLNSSTGAYICFLDADDMLHPQCLEIAAKYAIQNSASLICWNDIQDTPFPRWNKLDIETVRFKKTNDPLFLGCQAIIHNVAWGKLYQASLLKGIVFDLQKTFEDIPFIYAVFARRPRTVVLEEQLSFYRNNSSSITHQIDHKEYIKDGHFAVLKVLDLYQDPQLDQERLFLKQDFVPQILRNQLYRCRHAPKKYQKEMFLELTQELITLKERDMLSLTGHKFRWYLFYKYLLCKHTYMWRKNNAEK